MCSWNLIWSFLISIWIQSALGLNGVNEEQVVSGWIPYKDEKLFKVPFNSKNLRLSFDEAQNYCEKEYPGGSVPLIESLDELDFFDELIIQETPGLGSVWAGAGKDVLNITDFLGEAVPLTQGLHPRETCLSFKSDPELSPRKGQWLLGSCLTKNGVVCQRPSSPKSSIQKDIEELRHNMGIVVAAWNQTRLDLLEMRIKYERIHLLLTEMTQEMMYMKEKGFVTAAALADLKRADPDVELPEYPEEVEGGRIQDEDGSSSSSQPSKQIRCSLNPPVGFVYTQYCGQPAPTALWPVAKWMEITANYAGHFFRAEGGNSSAFGSVQEHFAPSITNVYSRDSFVHSSSTVVTEGETSPLVTTGASFPLPHLIGISFRMSRGEVRPRNQAIRIFRRVA